MAENLPHHTPSATPMQTLDWQGELPDQMRAAFPSVELKFKSYLGQNFVEVPVSVVSDILRDLRDREQFDMLTDLTAVDRPQDPERFEIIYILYSFSRNEYVRLKVRVGLNCEVPSAVDTFIGANWLEREVFDMFGIRFSGHPNLKRILLPDEWQGHPLLKETSITAMDNEWVQKNLGIESGQS
jgi:NADH-quinone oxidoreductase subunit C